MCKVILFSPNEMNAAHGCLVVYLFQLFSSREYGYWYPVLQVINHTLVYWWSFSILFSPQSIIAAFIFLLQYISQPIDVLYLFKRDQRLCRSLPIVLSEWTSNISFLRIEVTPDFHRANFIQKFHQTEAHLSLLSLYSVRSMDCNLQHW
jgi:hypothetical protein